MRKKNLLNFYDHLTHLIIHCFLHVNGYDHKKKSEFIKMKKIEEKILMNFDIKKPLFDMNQDNQEKLSIWKSWLIKKLLNNDSSKEEILNLIANEDSTDDKLNSTDDNNEKKFNKKYFTA